MEKWIGRMLPHLEGMNIHLPAILMQGTRVVTMATGKHKHLDLLDKDVWFRPWCIKIWGLVREQLGITIEGPAERQHEQKAPNQFQAVGIANDWQETTVRLSMLVTCKAVKILHRDAATEIIAKLGVLNVSPITHLGDFGSRCLCTLFLPGSAVLISSLNWASHTTITSTEDRHKRLSTGNFRRSGTSNTMVRWPCKTKVKVRRKMASKMLLCVAFGGPRTGTLEEPGI